MKIGVLSDTHGSLTHTKKALSYMQDCSHILHLGDVLYHGPRNPVHDTYAPAELAAYLADRRITYVRGNCDADVDQMVIGRDLSQKVRRLQLGSLVIYAVHGYEESLETRIQRALSAGANVLAWGHTHMKVLEELDGLTLLNPGSTSLPKDGSHSCAVFDKGRWGFHTW